MGNLKGDLRLIIQGHILRHDSPDLRIHVPLQDDSISDLNKENKKKKKERDNAPNLKLSLYY